MSTGKKRLLAYVIMVISLVISVKLVKDIIRLWNSDDRLVAAENELMASKKEAEDLSLKLDEIKTGEWWEKQVRNTLKMAKENEEIVIVPESLVASSSFREIKVEESNNNEKSNYQKWWKLFVY
ncbi:MAG: hypothetical protein ABIJ43_01350 [Candidatus Beckwithbacteria bacterium]|nr:hypothetical protein [Patescibacteria group bacterium]